MRPRSFAVLAAAGAATVALASVVAGAAARLPTPGTPLQVSALVGASTSITTLPSDLVPSLSQIAADQPATYYGVAGRICDGLTKCVFGDKKSHTLMVLFGDSHAQMWLPAMVPIANSLHLKLSLVWDPGCPVADVGVWDAATHSISSGCNNFRKDMIKQIKKAKPALVLLADRTSDIPGANNKLISDAVWEAGLKTTISELKPAATKLAVIGDIDVFPQSEVLPECLAANTADVQKCSIADPDPAVDFHVAAEQTAAAAEDVPYLNPQPWLCAGTECSPVIGNMVAYFDDFHVSATYSEYLSVVWEQLLQHDGLVAS